MQTAVDVTSQWNEPQASVRINGQWLNLQFDVAGRYRPDLRPDEVISNTDPVNNYFRVEHFAAGNISFVDGIGSNTGYFLKENLLHHSTTAAHEYGHTLGLHHPDVLDIRGYGVPGLMYPRGTLVDPEFQYDADALPGAKGGTLDPYKRKVRLQDIQDLALDRLDYVNGVAVLGDFTSCWHDDHRPNPHQH